jgi:hypothetical protein
MSLNRDEDIILTGEWKHNVLTEITNSIQINQIHISLNQANHEQT